VGDLKQGLLIAHLRGENESIGVLLEQFAQMISPASTAMCLTHNMPTLLLELAGHGQHRAAVLECLVGLTFSDSFGVEAADRINLYNFLLGQLQEQDPRLVTLALWVISNLCGNGWEVDPDDLLRKHFIVRGVFSRLQAVVTQEMDSHLADAVLWLLTNLLRRPALLL
jgi:hypothetical protein